MRSGLSRAVLPRDAVNPPDVQVAPWLRTRAERARADASRRSAGLAPVDVAALSAVLLMVVAGWMLVSPWILGYLFTASAVDARWRVVAAGTVTAVAAAPMLQKQELLGGVWWTCVAAGAALFASASPLESSAAQQRWNEAVCGLVVLLACAWRRQAAVQVPTTRRPR